MKTGIPKDYTPGETRVAATPETVKELRAAELAVAIETGAGLGAHFTDEAYAAAGAEIVDPAHALAADVVLKIHRPTPAEIQRMKSGAVLISLLDMCHDDGTFDLLAAQGVDSFALEMMPRLSRAQTMDVLSSQANIAGYRAVLEVVRLYGRFFPIRRRISMIFRQLFEPLSSTYTYLLGCEETGRAVLIDPVIVSMERDLSEISRLGLTLAYSVDTHIHADHITAARELKNKVGSKIAAPAFDRLPCTDLGIEEGVPLQVGNLQLQPLHTPGHTAGHFAYLFGDRIFTGDALLIEGCGRTDFQNGDVDALYESVHGKLFALPDDTLVYPAHDYKDRRVSSIVQEKKRNPRLGQERTLEQFREIMATLDLPYPKFIDYAVPGNQQCGLCPDHLPENLEKYCGQMSESPQG